MILAMTDDTRLLVGSIVIFLATVAAIWIGANPFLAVLRKREEQYGYILQNSLLLNIPARTVTILTGMVILLLGYIAYAIVDGSLIAMTFAAGVGMLLPGLVIKYLRRKRLAKLEDQLVGAVQTLASGVRAGLNLVQSMQMVSRDAPVPIHQEFSHLVREYEYGVPLDEAMENAAERIGSSDFRLLFTALHTHRERGGDLGDTLDRIAASIREIQRLENRVNALTAQGRATARWLGAMPGVVMAILYFIDSAGMIKLFTENEGNLILAVVVALNVIGFLWIRKIMAIDI
ncbi:MAG: type II secretion system F family protein [Phycisphaerae bacterium]|nr:type II secretion system F family protein [Phycisphaerae bacterium]